MSSNAVGACGVYARQNNNVACWGRQITASLQLANVSTPTLIDSSDSWLALAVGHYGTPSSQDDYSCGITAAGGIACCEPLEA